MNGDRFLAEVDKRIAILENINKQQGEWFKKIFEKIEQLPCGEHKIQIKAVEERLRANQRTYVVGLVLVVVAAVVASLFTG